MTKKRQTERFCAHRFSHELERWAGTVFFDTVLYNVKKPSHRLLSLYSREGTIVEDDGSACRYAHPGRIRYIGAPLITEKIFVPQASDPLASERTLIRHDTGLLSSALLSLL